VADYQSTLTPAERQKRAKEQQEYKATVRDLSGRIQALFGTAVWLLFVQHQMRPAMGGGWIIEAHVYLYEGESPFTGTEVEGWHALSEEIAERLPDGFHELLIVQRQPGWRPRE